MITSMRRAVSAAGAGLALALVLAANASPTLAGDWNNGAGSVKDDHASDGVPVPAPVPVPDYAARWYLRGDIGGGYGANPSVSRSGKPFGQFDSPGDPVTGPVPFGLNSQHFTSYEENNEFSPSLMFGVGAGAYLGRGFRIDVTAESHSTVSHTASGTYQYNRSGWQANADPAITQMTYGPLTTQITDCCGNTTDVPNSRVDGKYSDKISVRSGLFMVNGYWDLTSGGRFTPYVGAGVGVAVHEVTRTANGTETICDPTNPATCSPVPAASRTYSGSDKSFKLSLAAALMAGVSYNVSESVKLDFNYRYLYMGGANADMTVSQSDGNGNVLATTTSTGSVGAFQEHQLRAGVRFDIN